LIIDHIFHLFISFQLVTVGRGVYIFILNLWYILMCVHLYFFIVMHMLV